MLHVEWYHVCWPRLTAKRVEPVVSISWASCYWNDPNELYWTVHSHASYRYCQVYYKVRSLDLYFSCYISTTLPTASRYPRFACLPMTVSFTDKSGHMSTVSHCSRTSTSCITGLIPGRWPSIAKMSHHDHLSQTWKTDLAVQDWWWTFVYSWIIYISWCYHLQWPPLAWECPQYICQSYKSPEFRSTQYLPLYIWSQSPSLHLIDQTTPRIRISSMGSLYRSWFTSAWQIAASGSTVNFVKRDCRQTTSVSEFISELGWQSLEDRRKNARLVLQGSAWSGSYPCEWTPTSYILWNWYIYCYVISHRCP